MSTKNWIKFIFLGLLWGSSFMWIKIALQEVGPFTLVFFRTLFATLGLIIYFITTKRKFDFQGWWIFAIIGLFNVAIPFALISWAETQISSGLASILNSTVPLFTMLIASFFVEEDRLTLQRIIGLLIGFAGVVVLMSNKMGGNTNSQGLGIVAMLVAACCYAASGVFARLTNKRVTPQDQSLGQMATGFLFIITPAMIWESPFHAPINPSTWLALLWLGLLGSCVATLLWFALIKDIGPSRTSMTTYLFPLVGVILGLVVLNETLDWRLFAGGALVIAGIVVVNLKRKLELNIKESSQNA